jgi:two-component system response regulator HydG
MIYLESRNRNNFFSPPKCSFIGTFADFISYAAYHARERKLLSVRVHELEHELRGKYHFESIIGHDPKMVKILKLISQIAATDATVLIQGESGTGKELVARAIHYNSHRKDKPFVPVNCGGIPEHLLESELFGHVRGAFTGAFKDKIGWFERARNGTIFLDEVSEMSPDLQVRLLRVLQTGEYSKVGSTTINFCNVRILAASSKDLEKLVRQGLFREEVFYRLNVIDSHLPPLRERKDDILLLARHLLRVYGSKYGKPSLKFSPTAEKLLMANDFPGNVRELENAVQHAVVLAEGEVIESHHLPAKIRQQCDGVHDNGRISPFKIAKQKVVATFESEYISECLRKTKGKIRRAAGLAGMDVKNFHTKMKKYAIDVGVFKSNTSW